MLLQVHDELVFTMDLKEVDSLLPQIIKYMETAMKLSIPLQVEAKIGDNWGEMKPIEQKVQ
jgi:DNA polymerase-1